MPRIARVVVCEYPHHITQRGTNRTDIFCDEQDRRYFLRVLKEWLAKTKTRILAYCLMDNHFHLLLVPEREESLGGCLHGTTFQYAQYYNKKYRRMGRLWQNRYFSCPVDREAYLWAVARYIENNPVRAHITKKAEDWKWSSARVHLKGGKDEFVNLLEWMDENERKEYQRFVEEMGKEEEIRKATSTGRPLGSTGFVKELEDKLGRRLGPRKGGRPKKTK